MIDFSEGGEVSMSGAGPEFGFGLYVRGGIGSGSFCGACMYTVCGVADTVFVSMTLGSTVAGGGIPPAEGVAGLMSEGGGIPPADGMPLGGSGDLDSTLVVGSVLGAFGFSSESPRNLL